MKIEKMPLLRRLEILSVIYLSIVLAVSLLTDRKTLAAAILVGGAISILNFRLMQWTCAVLINGLENRSTFKMQVIFLLKNSFPLLALAAAVFVFHAQPLGLVLGLSSSVAAILAYAFWLAATQLHPSHGE